MRDSGKATSRPPHRLLDRPQAREAPQKDPLPMGGKQDTNLLSFLFVERTCNLDRGYFAIRKDGLHKAKR